MTQPARPKLLIIEDDLGLQRQMRWSLDQFEAVFADDHDSALAQLRRHEPAVATLDLGLPPSKDIDLASLPETLNARNAALSKKVTELTTCGG